MEDQTASTSANVASQKDQLAAMLERAKAEGVASEAQLEILSGDELTWEDYEAAVNATISCLEAGGLTVADRSTLFKDGTQRIVYSLAPSSAAETPVEDAYERVCEQTHSRYVALHWMLGTPDALAFRERRAQALREPFAQCLADAGADIPATATFSDLMDIDTLTFPAVMQEDGEFYQLDQTCYERIGADTWQG